MSAPFTPEQEARIREIVAASGHTIASAAAAICAQIDGLHRSIEQGRKLRIIGEGGGEFEATETVGPQPQQKSIGGEQPHAS